MSWARAATPSSVAVFGSPLPLCGHRRADRSYVGNGLQCPCRRLHAGRGCRKKREVALEAGRGADEQISRRGIGPVDQSVWDVAGGEGELAASRNDEIVTDLEDQLLVEHIEDFVEVVYVQWRSAPGLDDVLHDRQTAPRLFPGEQYGRVQGGLRAGVVARERGVGGLGPCASQLEQLDRIA